MLKERKSGPELLKILAIVLIVLSHVTQTLVMDHPRFAGHTPYAFLDITGGTTDPQQLVLVFLRGLGALGNTIFFSVSAWFLLDSKGCSGKKILKMLLDIWAVSVGFLILFKLCGGTLWAGAIKKGLLPTFYEMNWYLTAYLLFYTVHGFLNTMLEQLSQARLLCLSAGLVVLYFVFGTFFPDHFFPSHLIVFLTIYMAVAYMKRYLPRFSESTRANLLLLGISAAGQLLLILGTDYLNLKGHPVNMLKWNSNQNLFNLTAALALLNLFRGLRLQNRGINRVAGLTMLVYLIHENFLVRMILRPLIFIEIRRVFGYDAILFWVFAFAAGLFLASLAGAFLYRISFEKLTARISESLWPHLRQKGNQLLTRLLQIR